MNQDKPAVDCQDTTLPQGASSTAEETIGGDRIRCFGQYELHEEIARGGMGVVFKARQVKLNRIVALKMILSGELAGEEEIQRFKTEAEAAARLDHPGVVPIYDIGEHGGHHYFAMAYVEGTSLADRVKRGTLPPQDAAHVVSKVAEAVAYAHRRGVIHRDLKPSNVLLDADGEPKVTDFGLAKQVESNGDLTRSGAVMGTPSYMSPEQASGRTHDVGPRSDVYSLGAILYCLLTGRPPFEGASAVDVLMQVATTDPIPPRQLNQRVDRDLETICLKCLDKEPRARYQSALEVSEDLQRRICGHPIKARPVGRTNRLYRWCKRNKLMTFWIGAFVASLLYPLIVGMIAMAMSIPLLLGSGETALGWRDASGRAVLPGVKVERLYQELEGDAGVRAAAYRLTAGEVDPSEFRRGGKVRMWIEFDRHGETSKHFERTFDLTADPDDPATEVVRFGLFRIPVYWDETDGMEAWQLTQRRGRRSSEKNVTETDLKSPIASLGLAIETSVGMGEWQGGSVSYRPRALAPRITGRELWQLLEQRNDLTEEERLVFEPALSSNDAKVTVRVQSSSRSGALTEIDTDICLYEESGFYAAMINSGSGALQASSTLSDLRNEHGLPYREDVPEYAIRVMCRLLDEEDVDHAVTSYPRLIE